MEKNKLRLVVLLVFGLVSMQLSHAQESQSVGSKSVLIGINSDSFAGLELGYLRGSSLAGVLASCYLKFNIPLLSTLRQKKIDTWELEAGANLTPIHKSKFILRTGLSLFAMRHTQTLGSFLPLGGKLQLTPAFRTEKGYLGMQIRFQQVFCTHIDPSEYVKERFNEIYNRENNLINVEPESGFYSFTGRHLCLGVEGLFAVSNRLGLYVDLGMINYLSKLTGTFDSMMFGQIPFYTHIHVYYLIGKDQQGS